jgi:hypothetical protein
MVSAPSQVSRLVNVNSEERVIRVLMAPPEVLPSLVTLHSSEITILPVLLLKICSVGTIFVAVPSVVVVAVAIIVASFLLVPVLGPRYDRSDQSGAQYERAQN